MSSHKTITEVSEAVADAVNCKGVDPSAVIKVSTPDGCGFWRIDNIEVVTDFCTNSKYIVVNVK